MKNKIILGLVLVLGLLAPLVYVTAADYFPKDEKDLNNVVLNNEQIEKDDLYIAGGTVSVNKKVLGDLFSFGSSINVLGGVDEDLFAIGGNVIVEGPILGDARVFGGNITINNSEVGEDFLVAGGTVLVTKNTSIVGDLWVAGQVVNIAGIITGDVKILGGEIFLNAIVNGDLEVRSDSKLTFGPDTKILGRITYAGKIDPIIQEGAQLGEIERQTTSNEESKSTTASGLIATFIFKLLTLFVTVLVVFKLFSNKIKIILSKHDFSFSTQFWQTVGVGLLCLVFIPIVSLILLASVVGMYLSIVLFVWYMLAILVSIILSIVLLGGTVLKLQKSKMDGESPFSLELSWKTALIGVIVFSILGIIPVVGWLAIMIMFMSAFGTIVLTIKERIIN